MTRTAAAVICTLSSLCLMASIALIFHAPAAGTAVVAF